MTRKTRLLLFITILCCRLSATNISASGNVSGQWNADTVFVLSTIELPFGDSLTIQPGCIVLFDGYFRFNVWGKLIAVGNISNPIRFERKDTTGFYEPNINSAWEGIRVASFTGAPSVLEYCIFRFMKGNRGINLEFGSSSIRYCRFEDNKTTPLVYLRSNSHKIKNSVFSNNESGIIIMAEPQLNDALKFENNTITNNSGYAIYNIGYVNTVLFAVNCILWNNNLNQPAQPEIFDNKYEYYGFDTSSILLRNCIIKNGAQLPYFNSTCFTEDPKFVDTSQRNFALSWDNYPVNDATRSIGIDNGHHLGEPDADSTRSDIGAISFFRIERRNHTWARFSIDTALGYLSNLTVHFTNLSNVVATPVNWTWDFGDGNTSTDQNPVHNYTQTGVFNLKLKTTDQDGHQDSLILANAVKVLPGKRINPGIVSGTWEKQYNPYYIYGDIYVPDNEKLIIKPGVEVQFMGSYSFDVYGSLFAGGTQNDTISFKANDTTGMALYKSMNIDFPFADFQRSKGWLGIHFLSNLSEQDSCIMSYCRISDIRIGKPNSLQYRGALKLHRIKTSIIKNSLFKNNFTVPQYFITPGDTAAYIYQTAGIASIGSNPIIENNRFENLYQYAPSAIFAAYADSVKISGNTFYNIMNLAAAVEKIKSYLISNNTYDSIAGICLRVADADSGLTRSTLNEVRNNIFSNSGKAILANGVYKIRFSHNEFKNNLGQIDVGIETWGDKIYITNNLFYNNRVDRSISNVGSTCINMIVVNNKKGVIANNTLVDNYGFLGFQSIIYGDDSINLYNNILWNQSGNEMQGTHFFSGFAPFTKSFHNNVKGGYSNGTGNYSNPPLFVDSVNHNYRLRKTSSSINRGYADTTGLNLPATDFYSNTRIDSFLNRVDVGIAEYFTSKPVALYLSKDSIKENLPVQTSIGKLSTADTDSADTHSYSLINIPGVPNNNSDFSILNDSLRSAVVFSATQNQRKVSIRTTDQFGAKFDTTFTITITANSIITGVSDINEIRKIMTVYPVPFKNELILDTKNNSSGEWQIFSSDGRVIKAGVYRNKTVLNLSSLSAGAYILKITEKKKIYSMTVIRQ